MSDFKPKTVLHRRLLHVLGRFVRPDDLLATDRAFIETVYARWQKNLSEEIVDVGE